MRVTGTININKNNYATRDPGRLVRGRIKIITLLKHIGDIYEIREWLGCEGSRGKQLYTRSQIKKQV